MELEGKVALVTGSGQGVAKGIAVGLARAGARVVINDRAPDQGVLSTWQNADEIEALLTEEDRSDIVRLAGDAQSTADAIVAEGGEAFPFIADVSDIDAVGRMVAAAVDRWGRLDILVNSAAGLGYGPFTTMTAADWRYQLDAKLNGAFNTMHQAVPVMVSQGFGRIFNASSGAWIGVPNLSAYGAANAGLVALTRAVGTELWGTGVTVNAYCPSAQSRSHINFRALMRSNLERAGPDVRAMIQHVEEEHAAPEQLAPFFVYLSTDEAAHISCSVFDVTASGRVSRYAENTLIAEAQMDGASWTTADLKAAFDEKLLDGYDTPANRLTRDRGGHDRTPPG